jgi:hypothetical protein
MANKYVRWFCSGLTYRSLYRAEALEWLTPHLLVMTKVLRWVEVQDPRARMAAAPAG